MDPASTNRLIENGYIFALILLVLAPVVIGFVWKVLGILAKGAEKSAQLTADVLDRRLGDIVHEVRTLVSQQRQDSERLVGALDHHDERSQERHDKMIVLIADHHKLAVKLYEHLTSK